MSDEFYNFLGIGDRRGENVRVPIEEALDRLDLDLRRFATNILPPVYSLPQKRRIFFVECILANERVVPFMNVPTAAMELHSRCVPLSEATY